VLIFCVVVRIPSVSSEWLMCSLLCRMLFLKHLLSLTTMILGSTKIVLWLLPKWQGENTTLCCTFPYLILF
jgi:hypothetical protein